MDLSFIALIGMIPLGIVLGLGIYFLDSNHPQGE